MHKYFIAAMAGLALMPGAAMAQIIMDGQKDAAYGAAKALQASPTQFGDSNLGLIDFANGSELDAAYAVVDGGVLYILLTGNVESNFNKLELFFDTKAGGQNQLRGDNLDIDFNGLNRMGDDLNTTETEGLMFDTDFAADYWFGSTGGEAGSGYRMFANFAEILTDGGAGQGSYLGNTTAGSDGVLVDGNNPFGIRVTINNSNVAGVDGGNVNDPGAVTTGVEIAIPLEALGNPTGPIKVCAFVNGGGHDFVSNQVLGDPTLIPSNLGEPRFVDFMLIDGNQYFSVATGPVTVPVQPSSFQVQQGDLAGGGLSELINDDNQVLNVRQRAAASPATPNVGVIVSGQAPAGSVSQLDILVRAATTASPLSNVIFRVEAFNYDTNTWTRLYDTNPSGTGEQAYSFTVTGATADAHVGPAGEVSVRLRWFDRGAASPGWRSTVDQVAWLITR